MRRDVGRTRPAAGRVYRRNARAYIRTRSRIARTCLGVSRAYLDPRRHHRCELPSRPGRGAGRPALCVRSADSPGPPRERRDGVLQPRHVRAGARAARDDDHGVQSDRNLCRAEVGRGGSRSILRALAGHVLRRDVRRLFHARQSSVADGARILGRGNACVTVHGLRPPRRSGGDHRRDVDVDDGREGHRLRKPLPCQGWHLQTTGVEVRSHSSIRG